MGENHKILKIFPIIGKMLRIIGIVLLCIIAVVMIFLFWNSHRQVVGQNYPTKINTGGVIEQTYAQYGTYEVSYFEQDVMENYKKYEIWYPAEMTDSKETYPVIVINNGDIGKLSEAIADCDGAAAHMADVMQDNLGGQLTKLKSQAQEAAISFGTELMPVAQDLVGVASDAVQWFGSLDDGTKKLIVYAGLAAAAMGPLASGIGSVVTAGGKLVSTVGTMATAFSAAGGGIALTAVIGPAGWAVLAIGAVAAAGVAVYKDLHRGSKELDELNKKMEKAKESAKKLDEATESQEKLKEIRLTTYSTQTEEVTTVENLKKKLKDLVDENGKLIGSKSELKKVVKQLNEHGFAVELNKTGTLITNYKSLTGEIDNYVQQKKAQAMLDSLEPEYQNALKEKANYYSEYVENLAEMNELQKKLNDDEYLAGLSVEEYQKLCDTYNELADNADNAFKKYQSSCEVIDAYDKSMAAIAKGDFETAATILSGYYDNLGSTIKKSGDYAKEEQEKAITELSTQLTQQIQAYGTALQTGNQAVISDAKTYLEQAAEELEKAGLQLPEGFIQGVEDGSIGVERAVEVISNLPKKTAKLAALESENAIEELSADFSTLINQYGDAVKNGMDAESNDILAQLSDTVIKLRDRGVELPEGFIQGIKDGSIGADEAINTVSNMCDDILAETDALPNGMTMSAVNASLRMAATFESEGKAVPMETAEMVEKILAEYDSLPEDAKEKIKDTCVRMLAELENANSELYAAAEENGDSYISALESKLEIVPSDVREISKHMTTEFIGPISHAKGDAEKAGKELADSALAPLQSSDTQGEAERGGNQIVDRFNSGIKSKEPDAKKSGEDVTDAAVKPMGAPTPLAEARKSGEDTAEAYNSGIDSKKPDAKKSGEGVANAAVKPMGAPTPKADAKRSGQGLVTSMTDGMESEKPNAVKTAGSIMTEMYDKMGSVSFTGIGGSIVGGILKGINDKSPSLMKRATSLATGIAGVIGGALRINSPSKVMIPMGEAVAEGMEVGLLNGAGSLYETASAISLETAETLGSISTRGVNLSGVHSTNYGDRLDRLLDAVERLADSQTTMEIDGRPFGRLVREYV